jgi:hypothetical protein
MNPDLSIRAGGIATFKFQQRAGLRPGKHSKGDKRRYYLTARGSATESAALLDVCSRLKILGDVEHKAGKDMLVRVVSMLIKLPQSFEE